MAVPTENFRLARNSAPTYVVELELDHLVSYLNGIVGGFMEGKPWEHRAHVADHLETLHSVEADLAASLADDGRKQELQRFIDATRLVLHTLLRWLTSRDQA
jgi:hypothetical protein